MLSIPLFRVHKRKFYQLYLSNNYPFLEWGLKKSLTCLLVHLIRKNCECECECEGAEAMSSVRLMLASSRVALLCYASLFFREATPTWSALTSSLPSLHFTHRTPPRQPASCTCASCIPEIIYFFQGRILSTHYSVQCSVVQWGKLHAGRFQFSLLSK